MQALRIEEWHNRYHPGPLADELVPRFEKARTLVVGQALERMLEDLRLSERELVCIREIRVPVYLRRSAPLVNQATDWSLAIVEQIRRAIEHGDRRLVRYYRSKGDAWISCAKAVVEGDLADCWAWRQIALIETEPTTAPESALRKLFERLVEEPEYLMPVIEALHVAGLFELLLLRSDDRHWQVVRTILENRFNARYDDIFPLRFGDRRVEFRDPLPPDWRPRDDRSRLAAAGSRHAERLSLGSRQTVAMLIAALGDPGVLSRPTDVVRRRLTALYGLPRSVAPGAANGASDGESEAISNDSGHRRLLRNAVKTNETAPRDDLPRTAGRIGVIADGRSPSRRTTPSEAAPSRDETGDRTGSNRAATAFGGLLYLLNLVEQPCKLAAIAARAACFRQRTLVWVWLHLACRLVPASLDDPAVLAFAGQRPGRAPADDWLSPPSDDERLGLEFAAADLRTAAQDRLREAGSDCADDLERLFRRRALIESDPGWFEVEFGLNDVDTGIRRAGLDIDPGFLPWLAVVMRFRYA